MFAISLRKSKKAEILAIKRLKLRTYTNQDEQSKALPTYNMYHKFQTDPLLYEILVRDFAPDLESITAKVRSQIYNFMQLDKVKYLLNTLENSNEMDMIYSLAVITKIR